MFRDIDAECYIMTDGDDTYPAEKAKEMCQAVLERNADMVVGDRLSSTYFTENKRPFHNFGNRIVRLLINKLFNNTDVLSVDVNSRAVELARLNYLNNHVKGNCMVSNIYENVNDTFSYIITNPPIRAGKAVIYEMFEKAYDHLDKDGELWVVIRKQQGANSAVKKITEVFANCDIVRKEKGYYILKAIK